MSYTIIAKEPDLTFLITSRSTKRKSDSPLPIILKNDGHFHWDANSFLTEYGGGSNTYNIKPKSSTVVKKAYSLNVFCTFLEEHEIEVDDISDSTLYKYIYHIKERMIDDHTILNHGRTALEYIIHLSNLRPELKLSTSKEDPNQEFKLHYIIKKYKRGNVDVKYNHHESFKGLIQISSEPEYVRDYELIMWLDAINCTDFHPVVNDFLSSRWEAFTTLLEITGSRISEVHEITRTMIKNAAAFLLEKGNKPIIKNIPIRKGKYKGKTRSVPVSYEDIQIILIHINLIEGMFPNMKHDGIFVDSKNGNQLKPSYLKNYAKKVINGSKYRDQLRHLSNHSFRHRFITIHVAKAIKKLSNSGSFSNILSIAADACRKITMHASASTLSHYIHFADDINNNNKDFDYPWNELSSQVRIRLKKMISTAQLLRSNTISESDALKSFLSTLDYFNSHGLMSN
ncbi:site-specific integrase [Vibrio parahaemolyticus]|uniref:site-specific integrase n=1 Tax=Vibrio parahaemolyticus TaxID=670 RepID=UPI001EEA85C9|nr:site-specific integrase [Vibrio parahaemolyticus]MCG6461574.1 site-specific integrase [Vibrio parahaemolyticus]